MTYYLTAAQIFFSIASGFMTLQIHSYPVYVIFPPVIRFAEALLIFACIALNMVLLLPGMDSIHDVVNVICLLLFIVAMVDSFFMLFVVITTIIPIFFLNLLNMSGRQTEINLDNFTFKGHLINSKLLAVIVFPITLFVQLMFTGLVTSYMEIVKQYGIVSTDVFSQALTLYYDKITYTSLSLVLAIWVSWSGVLYRLVNIVTWKRIRSKFVHFRIGENNFGIADFVIVLSITNFLFSRMIVGLFSVLEKTIRNESSFFSHFLIFMIDLTIGVVISVILLFPNYKLFQKEKELNKVLDVITKDMVRSED